MQFNNTDAKQFKTLQRIY